MNETIDRMLLCDVALIMTYGTILNFKMLFAPKIDKHTMKPNIITTSRLVR
jgi:hypothetical protein